MYGQEENNYRSQEPVRLPRIDSKSMGSQINQGYELDEYNNSQPQQSYSNAYNSDLQNFPKKKSVIVPKLRIFLAEFLGTATLMFVGCMGGTAYSFGFALVLIAQMFSHISGAHVNSAVTIAALIMGKIDIITFPIYILAQFFGALVGYGLLWVLLGLDEEQILTLFCHTTIVGLSEVQAVFIEFIMTMLLTLAVSGLWDENNDNRGDSVPIKLGLLLTGIIIAAGPLTGASLNTFRSVAPAVFYNEWEHHWIYWVGPNLGGAFGALIYRFLLQSK